MELKNLIFLIVLIIASSAFAYSVCKLIKHLVLGKSDMRVDKPWERTKKMLTVAIGQSKLFREPVPGLMHACIFWGFLVLLSAILESIGEGLFHGFSLRFLGILYQPLAFFQELFALFVIIGVFIALARRYVVRPKRLEYSLHAQIDATAILITILFIMVSMVGQNATKISSGEVDSARFLSSFVNPILASNDQSTNCIRHEVFWWVHIVLVLGFLNYLPYSKHLHILTSIPNVFLSSLKPRGALKPIDLEAEGVEKFGASDVEDLTWKQLLDGYTCTECGRCTASCPANLTGKILSPRKIIMDIRKRLVEKGTVRAGIEGTSRLEDGEKSSNEKTLVHNYISTDELFACTTCMACMQECPVNIEHVDSIVDMRRYLVLMESNFPPEVQVVFKNLETNYSPWAFPPSSRAEWAEGMDIPLISQKQDSEILFWVGCAGAFDERYKKVTKAFALLMKQASVKFSILGSEEKCTGDSARRLGNEYLAQILMKDNIATLNSYNVKKIVTSCPHCFNTLKNEYPQFGGKYEVLHHTEFLMSLISQGKLNAKKEEIEKITYHDSCYLGRYNALYSEPRSLLTSINGIELIEMKRSRSKGFCCGAGGGRMWMEETEGKRVNIERAEEALACKTNTIATACPFCMTMLEDGVKAKEMSDNVKVKDVAELFLEATT